MPNPIHPHLTRTATPLTGLLAVAAASAAIFGASGCATLAPGALPAGTPIESVRHGVVSPTGEYRLPDGGTRLEFAQGSFGKQTWMLDFDASGRLVQNRQALTEDNFATILPGMSDDQVRMRLGRPAHVFTAGWQHLQQIWNYRYPTGDCVWFQVSIDQDSHRVTSAGNGWDPACDGPNAPSRD